MEGMFKQWIDERKKQGPDSQQIQIDSQQIKRVLKQQSLVEGQGRRRSKETTLGKDLLNFPCPSNASLPQQGEDVRNAALLGVDPCHIVEAKNSTCSVA